MTDTFKLASNWHGTDLPAEPKLELCVITCMDTRINPLEILDINIGDAHIIRNAGGVVTQDTLRSIIISQKFLSTKKIAIIQHSSCGLLSFKDEDLNNELFANTGIKPDFCFEAFSDLETNLIQSVKRILNCPFVFYKDNISAYILDIKTGNLNCVYPK
jgi:carbonic anhydrase